MGNPVLPPSRLHPGLHNWTWSCCKYGTRVQKIGSENDWLVSWFCWWPQWLDKGNRPKSILGKPKKVIFKKNIWFQDIVAYNNLSCFPYPLISASRKLVKDLGMLDPDEVDKAGLPLTARCVSFVTIGFCVTSYNCTVKMLI